jgi:hypothetical protein
MPSASRQQRPSTWLAFARGGCICGEFVQFRPGQHGTNDMKDRYFGAHEFQARDEIVQSSSERSFGLVFAGFFALLGALSLYREGTRWHYWFPLAALFAIIACVAPSALAPLNRLWTKFGLLLHIIVSPIFLGLLFYTCVAPTGFLMRLTGRDPLRRKLDPSVTSYWIVREPPGPAPETFKNQF